MIVARFMGFHASTDGIHHSLQCTAMQERNVPATDGPQTNNRRTQVPQGETSPGIVSACRVATRLQTAADGSLAQIIVILSVANGLQPPRDARIEAGFLSSRENRVHHADFRYGTITHVCHTGFPHRGIKKRRNRDFPRFRLPGRPQECFGDTRISPSCTGFRFLPRAPRLPGAGTACWWTWWGSNP